MLNGAMMQYFHWYSPQDGNHWNRLVNQAEDLAKAGFTALWLPPAYKGLHGSNDVGYGVYDLFDLGELEQQGSIRTKYGTQAEYVDALKTAQDKGLQVYADCVFSHKFCGSGPCGSGPDEKGDEESLEEEVQGELNSWGEWILDKTQVDGFRLHAVQELQTDFFNQWLDHVRTYAHRDLFSVGDYWSEDLDALHWFLGRTSGRLSLFDVPLHYNFHRASQQGRTYDLRRIFDRTLVQEQPALAVTFVENHRSQPLQSVESLVEAWFKPLAYALILLRRDGYPCVFQPDYEGAHYRDRGHDGEEHEIWLDSHRWLIDKFLYARQHHGYGEQYDYFNHREHIGWTRLGNATHPDPMAVLLSNGPAAKQWMEVGRPHTPFYDLTEHSQTPVITNEWGWGEFTCPGGSISVWLPQTTT